MLYISRGGTVALLENTMRRKEGRRRRKGKKEETESMLTKTYHINQLKIISCVLLSNSCPYLVNIDLSLGSVLLQREGGGNRKHISQWFNQSI